MALRVLMLRKRLDDKKKELASAKAVLEELTKREADLEKSIEEAETDEEKAVVEEAVTQYEEDKAKAEETEKTLSEEVDALENELAEKEDEEAEAEHAPAEEEKKEERKQENTMVKRNVFGNMTVAETNAILERSEVKAWANELRTSIREKRAIQNVGLTIPEVILPLLRENILNWSKLYDRVNVQYVSGEARQNVLGTIPEAVWTECCADLNELELGFNDWTVDCYKVGGFFALCIANAEDSDYDLISEAVTALGQAIGKALDKAILFGRNTDANSNMPQGVVTSLLQTTRPAGYPSTARAWVDLHTTHVATISASTTGADFFSTLINDSAIASTDYSRGELLWLMNDKTYKAILAQAVGFDSAGAVVAGMRDRMPVVGGDIEVLNFIPDNVIVFGYFDLYLLAERAGRNFASSEHVRFLRDQIVYKGTARYDGAPIIREAFGIINMTGSALDASTMVTFPQDTANAEQTETEG